MSRQATEAFTADPKTVERLLERMDAVRLVIPQALFAYNRNGLRMAIASIQDETDELLDEWVQNKRTLDDSCVRGAVRHELLDIASVAMVAYEETFLTQEASAS